MASTRPKHITSLVGCLTLDAPLHIGSGRGDVRTDSLVMLDRDGVPYVPGSTLAGILRDASRRLAEAAGKADPSPPKEQPERNLLTMLWGSEAAADNTTLSAIEVSDGILQGEQCTQMKRGLEVRDHVGIRRDRGVAQKHIKFDREVAPRGLQFWFELQLGDPRGDEEQLLNEVFELFSRRGGSIGGRTGTGLGEFTLELKRAETLDLGDLGVLVGFLKSDEDPRKTAAADPHTLTLPFVGAGGLPSGATGAVQACALQRLTWCRIDLRLDVVPGWPLLVKSDVQRPMDVNGQKRDVSRTAPDGTMVPEPVDANFVRTQLPDGTFVLTLPGSGLRGAFRSRAERIIRTMTDSLAAACDPTCRERKDTEREPIESCGLRHKGADDRGDVCLACQLFGCSEFGGHICIGEGAKVDGTFVHADEKLLDHVAIDRFTGGPVGSKKFTSRPLMRGSFTTYIALEDFKPWELGLVAYLLKDLHDADLRVGYGKAKGFGKVKAVVTGFRIEAAANSPLATMMQQDAYGFTPDLAKSSELVSVFEGLPRDLLRQAPIGPAFLPSLETPLARFLVCCAHECDKRFQEAKANG